MDEHLPTPDDEIEFLAEDARPGAATPPEDGPCWQVLIADDDPEVHLATKFAVRDFEIEGRRLSLLQAHSAAQAYAAVAAHPDLAVIILDVVMESETAGLDLVRDIRDKLGRSDLRIMLRTGQPGYAPEVETIRSYDINDYKTKSELSRTRLYASLTTAIRSFKQIRQLDEMRQGLSRIIHAGLDLATGEGLVGYAGGVVTQLCSFLETPPEGLVCASCVGLDNRPRVLAASGTFAAYIGRPLEDVPDATTVRLLERSLATQESVIGDPTCLHFPVKGTGGVAACIKVAHPIDPVLRELIEIFAQKLTSGFETAILQQDIRRLAFQDDLLEIPNRNSLIQWMDNEDRGAALLAVVDIDNFSDLNAALDQEFGNAVLRAVAERLVTRFGSGARVARLSADVFGLAGTSVSMEAIAAAFSDPFHLDGDWLRLSATAGLRQLEPGVLRGIDALRDAGAALKHAKSFARGKAILFDASFSAHAKERMVMLNNLRGAFSHERLFLVYQPVVDLADGTILGAEALIRWRGDNGHFIAPDRFIPLAEESGLMVHLGHWIMRTALATLRTIHDAGYGGFRMAINVSHAQFQEPDFAERLESAIAETGADPHHVELELTESVAISDINFIVSTLQRIRPLGVSVAIDDFGTGFSSLSVIRQLAVDRIKIDKSFIRDITIDPSIPGLIVALAGQLGMKTLAEGVETAAHRDALLALGVREAQGFLYARGLPAPDLLEMLGRGRIVPVPDA